ncbi:MAG: ABC transporter ATP-binding protein, partial [Candidatus Omnitrophota bacterium]
MMNKQLVLYVRFIKFILPYRRKWLLVLFFNVLAGLLSLIIPYLTKDVVDTAMGKKDFGVFLKLAIIGGSVFAIGELFNRLSYCFQRGINLKVNFDLHKKVFQHLQYLSYSWFQGKSTGEHIFKVNYDIDAATEFVTGSLPQVLLILPRAILILFIVFYLNWKIALCGFLLSPLVFLPPYFFSRIMGKYYQKIIESSEGITQYLQEVFSHIQLVKIWPAEKRAIRCFSRKLIANIRLSLSALKVEIASGIIVEFITKLIIGLITFYGGYLVIKQDLTLGSLTAIMVYLSQLAGLQEQFSGFWQASISGTISCGRIAEILDIETQIRDRAGARNIEFKSPDVRFDKVNFGYRGSEFVVRNISFFIKSGEFVALVGPSGAGKTTILNLLVRLYEPQEGSISIDNQDIQSVKLDSLKSQIGFAMQEHFLFDDTIFNNIAYCRGVSTAEEVEEVSRLAGVDDFVKELPLGYQTVIGENACKLSEGQKQKIAIARALLKKPKILILDEAMASMDSASEEKIILNIKEEYKGMAVIIVS